MNPYIKNPRILMLKCSIEYLYREETKFTSIDPIVLQVSHSSSETAEETSLFCAFLKEAFFVSTSGARVFEELCAAHRGCPSKPGVGGEDGFSYCSRHAVRAWHHTGHQRQTGQFNVSVPLEIYSLLSLVLPLPTTVSPLMPL